MYKCYINSIIIIIIIIIVIIIIIIISCNSPMIHMDFPSLALVQFIYI